MENISEIHSAAQESETGTNDPALEAETGGGGVTIEALEQSLAGKDSEISLLSRSLEEAQNDAAELTGALAQAVAAYRELVVRMNPGVLADMIAGDSIEGINESLASARAVMDKVRREVEADAARARVPAGAPQRTSPDMSALTAREKIQYGLGG